MFMTVDSVGFCASIMKVHEYSYTQVNIMTQGVSSWMFISIYFLESFKLLYDLYPKNKVKAKTIKYPSFQCHW